MPLAKLDPQSVDPVADAIGHLLRRVFTAITAQSAEDEPVSWEFVVLDVLADEDIPTQQDLAHRLGINRTIMVNLLDRLQQAGYVTRTRNPANRRTYVLAVTSQGRDALRAMRQTVVDRDARLTASLSETERRRLIELLTMLIADGQQPAIASVEHLIAQAHHRLRRVDDHKLQEYGLRTRHFGMLPALERLAPYSQQQLARYLDLTDNRLRSRGMEAHRSSTTSRTKLFIVD